MDPDDVVVRPARPDEAETLSHMIFRSRTYWGYTKEMMEYLHGSDASCISPDDVENDPTYVAWGNEGMEILGFYSMRLDGMEGRINHLWVMPEYVGSDIRSMLFLHACEVAETAGAKSVIVVTDPHMSGFYQEMGAELIGEKILSLPSGKRTQPILRISL